MPWKMARQISPSSRRLIWPLRPIIRWSCKTTPRAAAAFLMSWVAVMSALDGLGSPEGWLCSRINAEAMRRGEFDTVLDGDCQNIVNPLLDGTKYLPRSVSPSNYGYYRIRRRSNFMTGCYGKPISRGNAS